MSEGFDRRRVLDGKPKPKGWIRTPEARQALEARARDFVGMSARYAKMQAEKARRQK